MSERRRQVDQRPRAGGSGDTVLWAAATVPRIGYAMLAPHHIVLRLQARHST